MLRPQSVARGEMGSAGLSTILKAKPPGALGAALELLFPAHCVACGQAGEWLCPACLAAVPGQGRLMAVPDLHVPSEALRDASCLSAHTYPLREAVHGLKYEGLRVLADPLSSLLAHGWRVRGQEVDLLVPVPLHQSQLRLRGYNQSELLARGMAGHLEVPYDATTLVRTHRTRSQVGLSHDERLANVAGAFECLGDAIAGARVLLIDDVLTTGATLAACARVLVDAGARYVQGLTVTHALTARDGADSTRVDKV